MPELNQAPSLRDQLAEGLDKIEAAPAEVVAPVESAPADTGRARDDAGRFAAKAEEAAKVEPAAAAPSAEAPAPAEVKRPSSWKKEMWEKYDSMAPEVRDYILQREGEMAQGVHQFRTQAEEAKALKEAISPFVPDLQRHGIEPTQWIRNLGAAHQTLALGSPEQKAQAFAKLAQEYGVPLEYLTQGAQPAQVDPQKQWLTQQVQSLSQGWNHFQQTQAQQQQQAMQGEIERFATDPQHPHFHAVKDAMSGILQAGLAQDLQGAYDKAIRMNDELWQQQQAAHVAAQGQEKARQQAEVTAKAKAAAISPRSSAPSGKASSTPATNDRRAQLAAAFGDLEARV